MLCRNFELSLIKTNFLQFFKVSPKSGQSPCTIIVQRLWLGFAKELAEFLIKKIFIHILHCKFELILTKLIFFINF